MPESPARAPVLEVRRVSKDFPGIRANADISFALGPGEILAVLGENGAGKTTLMNVIYGLYRPTQGELRVRGQRLRARSPRDAIAAGIGMVHQHFQLIPAMSVLENVILGQETVKAGQLDVPQAAQAIVRLSQRYNLEIQPQRLVASLPVGLRQRVEIVKALYRHADILILDEPTAVLTPQETEGLFAVMRRLAAQGTSLIFITHKLREVMTVADRILILRQGRVAGETTPRATTETQLAATMVGRAIAPVVSKAPRPAARQAVLALRNVRVLNEIGVPAVQDVSLEVAAGEIVGLAGVQGNGQSELIEAIVGLRHPQAGRMTLDGWDIARASPRQIAQRGACGHVPEDRHAFGLVESFSVSENLILNQYGRAPFSRLGILRAHVLKRHAAAAAARFDIRLVNVDQPAGNLSGGNQQKTVVAREFRPDLKLLVAAQPTRGIDVGAIEFIHNQIVQQRNRGVAVLLASYELDEIMALSDRIAVMFQGRIIGIVPGDKADRNRLGLLMAGVPV